MAQSIPVRRVRERLASGEAVLEYVVGELRVYCLVLTNESAKVVALGQWADIEGKIDAYLTDIANKQGKTENGRALYAMLLEPLSELGSKSHLILIRDGKLHLLPWDALVDQSNRYLVETKNISYAPSVSSAILLRVMVST